MNKKLLLILFLAVLMVMTEACNLTEESSGEEQPYSYYDLKDMPELTVDGTVVTVVLLQDIPLPYRWAVTGQSICATLVGEYEVDDPYGDSIASGGSAQEYHVFVFELSESDVAELEFHNCWVVEPENLEEAKESRKFVLEYTGGQWINVLE